MQNQCNISIVLLYILRTKSIFHFPRSFVRSLSSPVYRGKNCHANGMKRRQKTTNNVFYFNVKVIPGFHKRRLPGTRTRTLRLEDITLRSPRLFFRGRTESGVRERRTQNTKPRIFCEAAAAAAAAFQPADRIPSPVTDRFTIDPPANTAKMSRNRYPRCWLVACCSC